MALSGLRVLDLTKVIAGPYCSMLLSDQGADVIKVEKAVVGDEARVYASWDKIPGQSLMYGIFNRNKRSFAVDFRNPQGIALIKELVKTADVLVENYRTGTMAKMGLDYEQLKAINPRLIMAHISGYGQTGPWIDRVAYDAVIQAASGLESMTGQKGGAPTQIGVHVLDYITGVYTAFGILAALAEREKSGLGQEVDCALLDSAVSLLETSMPQYLVNNKVLTRIGSMDATSAPINTYMAKDRYIHINGGAQAVFARLCKVMGREDLMGPFGDHDERKRREDEIDAIMADWVAQYPAQELEDLLSANGIPASVVRDVSESLTTPHVKERRLVEWVKYPGDIDFSVPGVNVKLTRTPGAVYRRPAFVGEHTEEILRELGKSQQEIDALVEAGVVSRRSVPQE